MLVRKREIEGRSLVNLAFGPDPAAVAVDDALDNGESHPGSLEVLMAVEALEDAEHLVVVLHVEPGAVVPHRIDALRILQMAFHFDQRLRALSGELDGIGKEVDEDLLDQPAVSRSRGDPPIVSFRFRSGLTFRFGMQKLLRKARINICEKISGFMPFSLNPMYFVLQISLSVILEIPSTKTTF